MGVDGGYGASHMNHCSLSKESSAILIDEQITSHVPEEVQVVSLAEKDNEVWLQNNLGSKSGSGEVGMNGWVEFCSRVC